MAGRALTGPGWAIDRRPDGRLSVYVTGPQGTRVALGSGVAGRIAETREEVEPMSYGTVRTYKSKADLRRAVESLGADNVGVYGTSIFGNETATRVSDLADTSAVIVGPSVETDRRWYANVKTTKDGRIVVK